MLISHSFDGLVQILYTLRAAISATLLHANSRVVVGRGVRRGAGATRRTRAARERVVLGGWCQSRRCSDRRLRLHFRRSDNRLKLSYSIEHLLVDLDLPRCLVGLELFRAAAGRLIGADCDGDGDFSVRIAAEELLGGLNEIGVELL